jgi:hypothetical protein
MTDEAKTEQELALEAAEKEVAAINEKREGKGTRLKVGQTRGRNPQIVRWEFFDESKPETLPTSWKEFTELTNITEEGPLVALLIDGLNSANYTAASDPVAEFVEATWPEEVQKAFRVVVRQYSANASVSIEDAVALIKPGIVASQKKLADKAAAPSA